MKQKKFATLVLAFILAFVFTIPHFALFALGDDDHGQLDISPMEAVDILSTSLRSAEPEPWYVVALLRLYLAQYIGLDMEMFLSGGDWHLEVQRILDDRLGRVVPPMPEDVISVGTQDGRSVGFLPDGSSVFLEEEYTIYDLPIEEWERLWLISDVLVRHEWLPRWFPGILDTLENAETLIFDTVGLHSFDELMLHTFTSPVGGIIIEETFSGNSRINALQASRVSPQRTSANTAFILFLRDSLNNSFVWNGMRDCLVEEFLDFYEGIWLYDELVDDYQGIDPFQVGGHRRITATTSPVYRNIVQIVSTFPTGASVTGSGFLISPNVVLTAGHNLHDRRGGGWATSVSINPARNGLHFPFGTATWNTLAVGTAWYNTGGRNNGDWGAIRLNQNFHTGTSFFNVNDMLHPTLLNATILGYPHFAPGHMYTNSGSISTIQPNFIRTSFSGGYGYSGGPLFIRSGSWTQLLGITVSQSDLPPPNNHTNALMPTRDEIHWIYTFFMRQHF